MVVNENYSLPLQIAYRIVYKCFVGEYCTLSNNTVLLFFLGGEDMAYHRLYFKSITTYATSGLLTVSEHLSLLPVVLGTISLNLYALSNA